MKYKVQLNSKNIPEISVRKQFTKKTTMIKGMEIRKTILQYSLLIEKLSSAFLAQLLNISESSKSKTLGNKSGNLSFNQKIDLLIDIEAIENKEKSKFQQFMSIRNQFMHNLDADTYENCLKNIDGGFNFLLKNYPQNSQYNKETQIENAVKNLAEEILDITANLINKVKAKISVEVETEMLAKYQNNSHFAIEEIEKTLNEMYEKKLREGEKTFDIEELKTLGEQTKSFYYKIIIGRTLKE